MCDIRSNPDNAITRSYRVAPVQSVTGQVLADILTTAIEGGSNYWIQNADSITRTENGDPVYITNLRVLDGPPREGDPATFDVSLGVIADGIRRVLDGSVKTGPQAKLAALAIAAAPDDADYDAGDADVFLQAGLFGEVVFG